MIDHFIFPVLLKQADTNPMYKKDSKNDNRTYRPVGILHIFSKNL